MLEIAIEEGVKRGYYLAHKHVGQPSESSIIDSIQECVMSSIYEYFDMD